MKKLIKLAILLTILLILSFSENEVIKKGRTFFLEKGRVVFNIGIDKMSNSENENVANAANIIGGGEK